MNPPPVGMASKKKAPAPETLDAKYIADVLGSPLTAALAEVAEKRPWDPIEFLAQWLYKHKANLNYHQAVSNNSLSLSEHTKNRFYSFFISASSLLITQQFFMWC